MDLEDSSSSIVALISVLEIISSFKESGMDAIFLEITGEVGKELRDEEFGEDLNVKDTRLTIEDSGLEDLFDIVSMDASIFGFAFTFLTLGFFAVVVGA